MKIKDFNKAAPARGLPPKQVIQIGDGRKEKALQDEIDALKSALEATQTAFNDANLVSKQSQAETSRESVKRRTLEGQVETLAAIAKQQEKQLVDIEELKGLIHVAEMAQQKAERQAKVNSGPRNMSQGAIESSTGFKMPGFGSVIPRKHLGGGTPNLVQYRVKEN